jgi:hypothetical protein
LKLWSRRKSLSSARNGTPTAQTIACRYSDKVILKLLVDSYLLKRVKFMFREKEGAYSPRDINGNGYGSALVGD